VTPTNYDLYISECLHVRISEILRLGAVHVQLGQGTQVQNTKVEGQVGT
jgi:hypothetical protein